MGRQHTTWISDETWNRLQNIAGESVSKKISNAVKFADPDEMMRHTSFMRQHASMKRTLREVARMIDGSNPEKKRATFDKVADLIDQIHYLWSADMDVKE